MIRIGGIACALVSAVMCPVRIQIQSKFTSQPPTSLHHFAQIVAVQLKFMANKLFNGILVAFHLSEGFILLLCCRDLSFIFLSSLDSIPFFLMTILFMYIVFFSGRFWPLVHRKTNISSRCCCCGCHLPQQLITNQRKASVRWMV